MLWGCTLVRKGDDQFSRRVLSTLQATCCTKSNALACCDVDALPCRANESEPLACGAFVVDAFPYCANAADGAFAFTEQFRNLWRLSGK